MIGCLRVRKQPIIALYFESENELKFYNLEACSTEEETQATIIKVQENDTNSPWAVILITLKKGGGELLKYAVMVTAYYMSSVKASKMNRWR